MKTKIPDELKADVPQTKWGKILIATPIIMTVIATMLAGLSSSEMTKAQYSRSMAAQLQSKAGDQWSFFQFKKQRGVIQRSTLDIIKASTEVHDLDMDAMEKTSGLTRAPLAEMDKALAAAAQPVTIDPNIKAAMDAVGNSKPESEVTEAVKKLDDKSLADALQAAKDRAEDFDNGLQKITPGIDKIEKTLSGQDKAMARDFSAVRLNYYALRYDMEARLNQSVAGIYELQVRRSDMDAERHHQRSQRFFYGMLAAQMGVILSTFALAAQKRSWLWLVAAGAGLIAISFAVYVYLCV
jgi:hypothetical protein